MRRNLSSFGNKHYDLIIVGGGIFGICVAWDAVLRGLSVAILERGDFAHATSANCFKMVHGGIRYIQHGDLYRIRESSRERSVLLRVAPHLVQPLPIVIPTYGHGLKGKALLRTGVFVYDLITLDRNRGLKDPERGIPWGDSISREECLRLFPELDRRGLTGGVVFHDGQMYSPARLALSFLKSAVAAGVDAANYVEVTGMVERGGRIVGVKARDTLTDSLMEARGRVIVNATGPWADHLLEDRMGLRLKRRPTFSRDVCFVVSRQLTGRYGLAVQGTTSDPDAILSRGRRHLFIVPWRDRTLVGVWHVVHTGDPDDFTVTERNLQSFLDEINEVYPGLGLCLSDVALWNAGLTLFGDNKPGAADLSYGKRSLIVDHAKEHAVEGLVSLIGVRYTTATGVATKVNDLVFKKLGKSPPKPKIAETPVHGGTIQRFEELLRHATEHRPPGLSAEVMPGLVHNHGAAYREVLRYGEQDPACFETVGASMVIRAEVMHAVREEMAQRLGDVVFRRTDLGDAGHPGRAALDDCAELMGEELGWSEARKRQEIEGVAAVFPSFAGQGDDHSRELSALPGQS